MKLELATFTAAALMAPALSGCSGETPPVVQTPEDLGSARQRDVGDCGVSLSSLTPGQASPGTTVTITGNGSCAGGGVEYEFWIRPVGGSWSTLCTWQTLDRCRWRTDTYADGAYNLQIWTRTAGSGGPPEGWTDAIFYQLGSEGACTSPTLDVTVPNRAVVGIPIELDSESVCTGGTPDYQFWVLPPGGSWQVACDYGSSDEPDQCFYTPTVEGIYEFEVYSREQSNLDAYDDYSPVVPFAVDTSGDFCSSATMSVSLASGHVDLLGEATCSSGTPQFQYWVRNPSSEEWDVVCDWTTGPCAWAPTVSGNYLEQVWTRAVGSSAPNQEYSDVAQTAFDLYNAGFVTTSPGTGGVVNIDEQFGECLGTNGVNSDCTNEYEYWVEDPGGNWTAPCGWTTSTSCGWDTTGLASGTYSIQAWARVLGFAGAYQGYTQLIQYNVP